MAGTLVEDSAPLTVQTGFQFAKPVSERQSLQSKGVTVLIERVQSGKKVLKTAVFSGSTSIQQVQLKGRLQGWIKSGEKLVLGGRELLEHEYIGQLPQDAATGHLHFFVKLSDLSSLSLLSPSGSSRTFVNPRTQSKSALTAALADSPRDEDPQKSLVVRGVVVDSETPLEQIEKTGEDVLHLIIRRPKVNYRVERGNFELTITATDDIQTIKEKVEAHHGLDPGSHSLVWNGKPLSATKSLASYGLGDGSILELVPIEPLHPQGLPANSPVLSSPQHELYQGWLKARAGLAAGRQPKLAPAGTGGSYFIQDAEGLSVAVFKPEDEEPWARNNPRGHSSYGDEGYRRGVKPGEGAVREVAAFLLDHGHFAGVPPTALVSCQESSELRNSGIVHEPKIGSLQAYISADGDCEERGTGIFSVEQVHKIAILDIRLGNCDRNGGNILVKKKSGRETCQFELIPIDHGYTLPSTFADISFEWMYWPQAAKPFSERSREYIASLDVDKDEQALTAHGLALRPECNRVRKVCTMLLKKAVDRELTPADIAAIMCRENLQKSPLEKMHTVIYGQVKQPFEELDEALYLQKMSECLDELLESM